MIVLGGWFGEGGGGRDVVGWIVVDAFDRFGGARTTHCVAYVFRVLCRMYISWYDPVLRVPIKHRVVNNGEYGTPRDQRLCGHCHALVRMARLLYVNIGGECIHHVAPNQRWCVVSNHIRWDEKLPGAHRRNINGKRYRHVPATPEFIFMGRMICCQNSNHNNACRVFGALVHKTKRCGYQNSPWVHGSIK